jgi:polysaccharide export outer membrane protein
MVNAPVPATADPPEAVRGPRTTGTEAEAQPPRSGVSSFTLRPGDAMRVTVWRNPELSGDFRISNEGTLQHPLYRSVQVTGVPLSVVEERVRELVTTYVATPQILIEPLVRVSVNGEVRSPSLQTLPPETTIAQAIALSGGATDVAKLNQVQVVREGRVLKLDLAKPGSANLLFTVRSGDQIVVPRRRNVFRDVIGPVSSLAAAVAAIFTLIAYSP